MESEIRAHLIRDGNESFKQLIVQIFRLVFKLKQWPDFKGEDKRLIGSYKAEARKILHCLNLV